MELQRLQATIREVPTGGWMLLWDSGAVAHYNTAAEAFKAVKHVGEEFAAAGVSTITSLEWTTISRVGNMVARAKGK